MLSHINNLFEHVPFLKRYYLRNYSELRYNLFRANQLIPLIKFPRYVHFLITFDCNFGCKQCQVNANDREADLLTYEEITRVIREIRDAGVRHLIITGGEALVRDDVFDILRFAGDCGIPHITLATNGYLVERYRKELADLRIDRVVTSIDDVGEKNDAIRCKKGAFERSLKALEIFKEIGVPSREINTTVFPDNISSMNDLAKYVAASPATNWIMGTLIPMGRANTIQERYFTDEEFIRLFTLIKELRRTLPVELLSHTAYLKNYFEDITSEPFFCRAGIETCSINPDGNVLPCNIVNDACFSQGNVREKSFQAIWKDGFKEIRNPQLPDDCNKCQFLAACRGGCWGYRGINERYCYMNFCT